MTQLWERRTPRRGRVFPESQLSAEEKSRRKAEGEAFYQRCRAIFERVTPALSQNHYDWFIVIEPDSGEYFIDADEKVARKNTSEKHAGKKRLIACINETEVAKYDFRRV